MANFPLPALPARFDPSQPFSQVPDVSAPAKPAAPAAVPAPVFNPEQPFEAIPDAPATPAVQFNASQPFQKLFTVDDVAAKSREELTADKEFNPTDFFANNPDVANNPANLKKLLETYRARREEGIQIGETAKAAAKSAIPTLGKFAKGAYQTASNLFVLTGLQDLANDVLGAFEREDVKRELKAEGLRAGTEAQAKAVAAAETSATGIADLARTGARKVFGKSVKDQTDQELLQELATDAAFQTKLRETTEGRGELLKSAGLDADELAKQGIQLDPSAIENMSLVDPLTLVATGGVGKLGFNLIGKGGKVLATVPSVQAGIQLAEKLGTAVKPILEKLPTAGQVIGKPIEVAGKGISLAGRTAPLTSAVIGTVKGGPFGTIAGIYTGERIAPRLVRAGESVQQFGQQVAGKTALSPALASIVEGTKLASPLLTSPLKGAAIGAGVALPLALAAEGSEQAGAILGGGLGLGAAGGLVHGTARVGGELAARTFFDSHSQKFEIVPSPDYGVDAFLDTAHRQNLAKRSVNEQGDVTTAREIFRPLGGEIYSVDKATFGNEIIKQLVDQLGRSPTPEELASIQGKIDAQGYFDFERPDGRKVVLLNADSNALWHESGHLTYALLPDQVKAGLADAVRTNYTPEQFSQLKAEYEGRLGGEISEAKFIDELVAENFNAVFNNVPVTELKAPAGFLRSLGSVLAQIGETLGADATRGRTSPDLNVPLTQRVRAQFEKAARDLLKAPEKAPETPPAAPAAPGTPTPPAGPAPAPTAPPARPPTRNIRVTKEQQDALAQRAAETGITEARMLAATDADPNVAARVNEVSAAMEAGNPVLEIEHLGIADTGTPAAPTGRAARRGAQEAGYAELERLRVENRANAPADLVNLHQKTFTPVRWTAQGKTPTLIAMSADKVISNLNKIAKLAADKGAESLLPYEIVDGRLTDAGWRKALSDVQAYAENQANGFRGDGQRLTRPAEGELSIPAENRDYVPTQLSPEVANFANLVQGLATPETAREIRGRIPGNVKGQILAEANKRQLLTPADIKPKNVGKQAFKSFPGRSLAEVNPLRNELVSRGVNVRELLDVTERIRAKDIASVKQRPELNFKAPVTDVIRGGFLPEEQTVASINEEIRNLDIGGFKEKIKQWGKSLTAKAFEVGQNVKSRADIDALREFAAEQSAISKADLARGDFDAAGSSALKLQFFREAMEAATGEGGSVSFIRKYTDPNYVPPFPTEGVQFLPREKEIQNIIEVQFGKKTPAKTGLKESLERVQEKFLESGDNLKQLYDSVLDKLFEFFGSEYIRPPSGAKRQYRKSQAERALSATEEAPPDNIIRDVKFLPKSLERVKKRILESGGTVEQFYETVLDKLFGFFGSEYIRPPSGARRQYRSAQAERVIPAAPEEPQDNIIRNIKFLPKNRRAAENLPEYLKFPEQGYVSAMNADIVRNNGVTPQFWLNAKTGKVLLASEGHVETARDLPGIPSGAEAPAVYDAMDAAGWLRGVAYGDEGTIQLDGTPILSRSARQTMEDIAFKAGKQVVHDGETVVERPTGPDFLPRKKKIEDERDFSKYDVQPKKSAPATGWILPDKTFVPLKQSYHEQYLAENADALNSKYRTKFSSTPDVEERLAALNAGFTRIRKESSGDVHVEVNEKFWSKQKPAILDQLLEAADTANRATVSILNKKGQVVDSQTVRLFDAENPAEAVQSLVDELRPGGGPQFLPVKDMSPKEQRAFIKGIQEAAEIKYPEAIVPEFLYNEDGSPKIGYGDQLRRQEIFYNFEKTKLAQKAAAGKEGKAATEAAATALGDKLAEYYNSIKDRPEIAAGITWYSLARKKLVELFGDDAKFFAELLGATSPQTPVKTNFQYALDAYNQFKSGKFDAILSKYREGKQKWATGDVQEFLDDTGRKLTGPKAKQATRGQFLNWWIEKNELVPYRSEKSPDGKPLRYGMHSKPLLRVLDGTWLEEVVGPKTPNFMGNLTGDTFAATIDIWAARALHRMGAEESGKRWRILPESETGVNDADFAFGQRAYQHAADKVGLQPDALQAILWFAEKDHYEKNGWATGQGGAKEKSDFNTFFAKTEKVGPGQYRLQEEPKIKKKKVAVVSESGDIAGVKKSEKVYLPGPGEIRPKTRVRVEKPARIGPTTRGYWETVKQGGTRPAIFDSAAEAEAFIKREEIEGARVVSIDTPFRQQIKFTQETSYVPEKNND